MEELKQNIIKLCNESQLPLEAILFVVRDTYRDIDEAYRAYKEQLNNEKEKKGE